MHEPNENEESATFPNVERTNEQDIPDEHVLDFLVAFGRAAEKQDGGGSGDHIADSDNRFLRNFAGTFAGDRKKRGAEKSETESDSEGRPAFQIQMKENCDTNA